MEYNIDKLLEFSKANIALFDEKYEMFLATPEELVGKKVISTRSGFSRGPGQVMLVNSIETYGNELHLHLVACEETSPSQMSSSWGCPYKERFTSLVYYKPELKYILR